MALKSRKLKKYLSQFWQSGMVLNTYKMYFFKMLSWKKNTLLWGYCNFYSDKYFHGLLLDFFFHFFPNRQQWFIVTQVISRKYLFVCCCFGWFGVFLFCFFGFSFHGVILVFFVPFGILVIMGEGNCACHSTEWTPV